MKSELKKCSVCGAEIASSAKNCPSCGAKQKRPFYKKWWFWVVIVLLIGSAGGGGTRNGAKPESSSVSSVQKETQTETPAPEPKPKKYEIIGDVVFDNINNLSDGGTWKFKAIGLSSDNAASWELADITGW